MAKKKTYTLNDVGEMVAQSAENLTKLAQTVTEGFDRVEKRLKKIEHPSFRLGYHDGASGSESVLEGAQGEQGRYTTRRFWS